MGHFPWTSLVGIGLLLLLVGGLKVWAEQRPSRSRADLSKLPVKARRALLNSTEQKMYAHLVQACPDHLIFCQVSLRQLIDLAPGAARGAANHFQQLSADFVVCTRGFEPLWVVELDGPTHRQVRQAERDARKNAIIQAAGLRLLRIEADALPSIEALRRDLCIATASQAA
jgi:hypothetical protein